MSSIEPTKRGADGRPLKDAKWRARYRDLNGRSRSQTFTRKSDAKRFLERNSADMQRGEWIDPRMRRSRFDDWAAEWWATTVRLQPTTRNGYYKLLHGHVLPYFGGRAMASIDFMDVERFIAEKLKAGHNPKRVRDMVSIASLIMQCAMSANARRDNPARGHKLPVRPRKIATGDVPDMEQLHVLLEHTPEHYRPAMWTVVLTGMRPSEMCGMKVRDFEAQRKRLLVRDTLLPVPRFGDEAGRMVDGPTKTPAGDRAIPIPDFLVDMLAAMLEDRAAQRGGPVSMTEHLFVRPSGRPINRDGFRVHVVRPALRAAGLPESLRTYDLRHAHASQLIDLGANPLAVAARLGHADPAITMRVYGHLFEGVQEQLTASLEDLRASVAAGKLRKVVRIDKRRSSGTG